MVVGLPVRPVAVKVTGGPPKLELVALRVLVPAAVPRVQLPTVAIPEASLVALAPVIEPPPSCTAKVTGTPATGLSLASTTSTLGGMVTGVPTCTVWPFPAFMTILFGAPAMPVAVKVTGDPVRPAREAVSVFAPAVVPNRQLPTVAIPAALVVGLAPVTEPPPEATAKVTTTPETGLPPASVISDARVHGDVGAGHGRLAVAGVQHHRGGRSEDAGRRERHGRAGDAGACRPQGVGACGGADGPAPNGRDPVVAGDGDGAGDGPAAGSTR